MSERELRDAGRLIASPVSIDVARAERGRKLGEMIDELRDELEEIKADRRRVLDRVLCGDLAEARVAQEFAAAVDEAWIAKTEANIAALEQVQRDVEGQPF